MEVDITMSHEINQAQKENVARFCSHADSRHKIIAIIILLLIII
jgi:hypothetical protein